MKMALKAKKEVPHCPKTTKKGLEGPGRRAEGLLGHKEKKGLQDAHLRSPNLSAKVPPGATPLSPRWRRRAGTMA